MKTVKLALALVLGFLAAAPALAAHLITYRIFTYTCDGGRKLAVSYVRFGDTNFAVLNYAGRQYGLAEATSGSGSRFASLTGPVTAQGVGNGLEWWEAKGEGTLSTFTGTDTAHTKTLLTGCKVRR